MTNVHTDFYLCAKFHSFLPSACTDCQWLKSGRSRRKLKIKVSVYARTVALRPVLGTLQRTDASWECLHERSGTSWERHCVMELSRPEHCTAFMWIGPVPAQTQTHVPRAGHHKPVYLLEIVISTLCLAENCNWPDRNINGGRRACVMWTLDSVNYTHGPNGSV